ncbi:unnamed protein product [Amoebophrya sp. A120]|nr:unnamed protein product [Amoebophrya sp. A120]|eukprot:GSA120T00002578001.1
MPSASPQRGDQSRAPMSQSKEALTASERAQVCEQWVQQLRRGVQLDGWGQLLEATDEYTALASNIGGVYARLDSRDKDVLHRVVLCLSARVQAISSTGPVVGTPSQTEISSQDLRLLEPTLQELLTTPVRGPVGTTRASGSAFQQQLLPAVASFPISNFKWQYVTPIVPQPAEITAPGEQDEMHAADFGSAARMSTAQHGQFNNGVGSSAAASSSLPGRAGPPTAEIESAHQAMTQVNGTLVVLKLAKIGLKDAETYIDPFLTVLVTDGRSNQVIDQHDLPVNIAEKRATHVHFHDYAVYLRVSLEDMQRMGSSLFFEFKHYKPKKKKISTRCWCFMELNELKKDEECVLEIYHKPTDLRKKKINLHSVKPLYFHLKPSFMS